MCQEKVKMSIAIVTDSTSDISSQLAYENDIHVVPAVLIMDGRSLEDGQGISREEFYRQLPLMKTLPTTAAPASGAFQRLYESLFEQGIDQIISIHVSSLLSGMYNAVVVAAKAFGKRVLVVDSGHQALQHVESAQLAQLCFPPLSLGRPDDLASQALGLIEVGVGHCQ